MIIPITCISALEYWLDGTDKNYSPDYDLVRELSPYYEFHINQKLFSDLTKEFCLSFPLHVMAPRGHNRKRSAKCFVHAFPAHLPPNSFVEIKNHLGDTIFINSPEACFLYAASVFPFYDVVRIGCLLCASFVTDKSIHLGQRPRKPLTSILKIQKYLNLTVRAKGIDAANAAISLIAEQCNSPMEVSLAVLANLPINRGGYALARPVMNAEIKLSLPAKKLLKRESIRCDFVWENKKTVIEYESNLTHLEKEQHEYDKKRSTAISLSGYQLFNITANQVSTFQKTEETFLMIRKILGLDLRSQRLKEKEALRHDVVREILLKRKSIHEILGTK